MKADHRRGIDLNLLKVLEALVEEGGVTKAGRRLGLTQPAVSHALNRLRHQFGDPLFIRTSDGMGPTPRALEIAQRVRIAMDQLEQVLQPARFEPASASQCFTLALGDSTAQMLVPSIVAAVKGQSPRSEIHVSGLDTRLTDSLDQGHVNLAIGGFRLIPERYERQNLYSDGLVWVMRACHPLAGRPLTLEGLANVEHLVVESGGMRSSDDLVIERGLERRIRIDGGQVLKQAFKQAGLQRKIAATIIAGNHLAIELISKTSLAALLPARLAHHYKGMFDLATFEPPHATPTLEFMMIWRREFDTLATEWFRTQVATAARALGPIPGPDFPLAGETRQVRGAAGGVVRTGAGPRRVRRAPIRTQLPEGASAGQG